MSFAKNVHRYQKYVLGGIVALMALTLVISGNFAAGDGDDRTAPFAKIFGTITVTRRDWQEAWSKSTAWFRMKAVRKIDEGKDYNSQQFREILFEFRGSYGALVWHDEFKPTEDDLNAAARELIILGADARSKQVKASDEEVTDVILGYLARAKISESDVERQQEFAPRYFGSSTTAFREAIRDSILVDKALALDVGGSNVSYEEVFSEKLAESRSIRVLVAGFDGAKLPGDLVSVTDDEIRQAFEAKKADFKMPAKVQIEYLMASFDDLKKGMKEPTPEEIQKYYDENKRQFMEQAKLDEGHSESDGHDHGKPEEKLKPLEQVREEIIKKIKDTAASAQAFKTVSEISTKAFAERWYQMLKEEEAKEPKDRKSVLERTCARTAGIFAELQSTYRAKGIELRNGITLPVNKDERDPFDKELGKPAGSDPLEWAFGNPVGQVDNKLYRSDKGVALIRLAQKTEGYETDLTSAAREKIRQDLFQSKVGRRAQMMANDVQSRIRSKGASEVAALKARRDVEFQHSSYFTATTPDLETALKPSALAQQVKAKAFKSAASDSGIEVETVDGTADRKDWCYVVVVEDAVAKAPDLKDEDLLREIRQREMEEQSKAREVRITELLKGAEWTPVEKAKS